MEVFTWPIVYDVTMHNGNTALVQSCPVAPTSRRSTKLPVVRTFILTGPAKDLVLALVNDS